MWGFFNILSRDATKKIHVPALGVSVANYDIIPGSKFSFVSEKAPGGSAIVYSIYMGRLDTNALGITTSPNKQIDVVTLTHDLFDGTPQEILEACAEYIPSLGGFILYNTKVGTSKSGGYSSYEKHFMGDLGHDLEQQGSKEPPNALAHWVVMPAVILLGMNSEGQKVFEHNLIDGKNAGDLAGTLQTRKTSHGFTYYASCTCKPHKPRYIAGADCSDGKIGYLDCTKPAHARLCLLLPVDPP